jgi:hypothetical protein
MGIVCCVYPNGDISKIKGMVSGNLWETHENVKRLKWAECNNDGA